MRKENYISFPDSYVDVILREIKLHRQLKKYSQYQMAQKLFLSQNAYFKIENGFTRLDLRRLIIIASILEIKLSDLFAKITPQ